MQLSSSFFETLFKRKIIDPDITEQLQQIAGKYPFFTPAQFYLLLQKDEHSDGFNQQAAKTNILINNPYWLNFQLLKHKRHDDEINDAFVIKGKIPADKNQPLSANEPVIESKPGTPTTATADIQEKLIFEPLYTTDYFASQGIKLTEDIQSTDKLGRQLKSFTEWLKTMKKINTEKLQVDLSAQTDITVQTLADNSNAGDEILTETMAEVLIHQGKNAKAIEVYQKLSLLNPSKKVYFAAKIEQLKDH